MPNFLSYNGHGDLAAQANGPGTRLAAYTYDAFGAASQASLPGNATAERFTGRWDKQLDTASGLIEMGARPCDPILGRFLAVDPVEGGALTNYDYSGHDPINMYDLDGQAVTPECGCGGGTFMGYKRNQERATFERLRQSKSVRTVRSYGGTCVANAAVGAVAGGPVGAAAGCATSIVIKRGSAAPGRTGRFFRATDKVLLVVDIRRAAYKHLGVPTIREIAHMQRQTTARRIGGR